MFSRFDRKPACDRRTDRRLATAWSALCIASRGIYAGRPTSRGRILKISDVNNYFCGAIVQRSNVKGKGKCIYIAPLL